MKQRKVDESAATGVGEIRPDIDNEQRVLLLRRRHVEAIASFQTESIKEFSVTVISQLRWIGQNTETEKDKIERNGWVSHWVT